MTWPLGPLSARPKAATATAPYRMHLHETDVLYLKAQVQNNKLEGGKA